MPTVENIHYRHANNSSLFWGLTDLVLDTESGLESGVETGRVRSYLAARESQNSGVLRSIRGVCWSDLQRPNRHFWALEKYSGDESGVGP